MSYLEATKRLMHHLYTLKRCITCLNYANIPVPEGRTADERKPVRYRRMLVKSRTREKNLIHGILLQMSADPGAAPFSSAWLAQVRKLGDYRIDGLLSSIERYDDLIR